jgi:hypothetical protein
MFAPTTLNHGRPASIRFQEYGHKLVEVLCESLWLLKQASEQIVGGFQRLRPETIGSGTIERAVG